MSVVPVNHLDGAREGDPARQARRGEGDEVVGSKGFGLGRSTVPRAALSESQGVIAMGECETKLIRYNDHKVSRLLHRQCSQPDTWARRLSIYQLIILFACKLLGL